MSTASTPKAAPRSRAAAKEASREALIAAAMSLFSEKGLDVSLDELCARAGYTRGAFYVHFKDRDELIAAVMARVGAGAQDALLGSDPTEGIDAIVHRFAASLASGFHPVSKSGGVRPYQILDACVRSPAAREGYVALMQAAIARLSVSVRENQRAGAVRADVDPVQMATLLEALVIGLEVMHDLEAPMNLKACADNLVTLMTPPER